MRIYFVRWEKSTEFLLFDGAEGQTPDQVLRYKGGQNDNRNDADERHGRYLPEFEPLCGEGARYGYRDGDRLVESKNKNEYELIPGEDKRQHIDSHEPGCCERKRDPEERSEGGAAVYQSGGFFYVYSLQFTANIWTLLILRIARYYGLYSSRAKRKVNKDVSLAKFCYRSNPHFSQNSVNIWT